MPPPYKTLDEVRMNDATVHNMLCQGLGSNDIIVKLANEKAQLMRDLSAARMRNPSPIIIRTDKNITLTPRPLHTPQIHPHTPQ